MLNTDSLAWDKMEGLIPAMVQDAFDGRLLMQAYMTKEALESTLKTGLVTFWSRSRQELWQKGETSGNILELVSIHVDCDGDAILVRARPKGPVCHLGYPTCFDLKEQIAPDLAFLSYLEQLIAKREAQRPEGSYTTQVFNSGVKRIAQKVGEEGVETALAGASGDDKELLNESADLVYHLLVLLRSRNLQLSSLIQILEDRHR